MRSFLRSIPFLLLFNVFFHSESAANIPDMAIINMATSGIDDKALTVSFQVANVGSSQVPLSMMYYEVYLSTNPIYDPGDLLVKTVNFGAGSPVLSGTKIHTITQQITTPVNIAPFPYAVVVLKTDPGVVLPDNNPANNVRADFLPARYADLVPNLLQINSISDSTISLTTRVVNMGQSVLHLERFRMRVYLSQVANINNEMIEVSNKIIAGGPLSLPPNASLMVNHTFKANAYLNQHPYLIVRFELLPGKTHMQKSTANDFKSVAIGPVIPDLYVADINVLSATSSSALFGFRVGNAGNFSYELSKFYYYEVYVSKDEILHDNDPKIGESDFGTRQKGVRPHTVLDTTYYYSFNTAINLNSYPYVIVSVKLKPGKVSGETNFSNNYLGVYVGDLINARQAAGNLYEVSQINETVQVSAPSENNTSYYVLYSTEGIKIQEGSFLKEEEINTTTLKKGLYILRLSDGVNEESHRVVVR